MPLYLLDFLSCFQNFQSKLTTTNSSIYLFITLYAKVAHMHINNINIEISCDNSDNFSFFGLGCFVFLAYFNQDEGIQ